ncbi:cytochrome c oxidase assembly protein COX19 [Ischnura elegans]|uniref:cytochrome c oxidase assembly protein COX19 n=1 Tax=Ischnura elegans TaxID=197161 RepID=UPI001ED88C83|nr:cytochrome c oxidase assembly protein COX19 [Ischnura elegans]
MSSMTFGQKKFTATPPEKGSFPLDHAGICKIQMLKYMVCIRSAGNDYSACKLEARDYLDCRMKNNLMAPEEWKKLGFKEDDSKEDVQEN